MSTEQQIALDPELIQNGRYEANEIIEARPGHEQELAMIAVRAVDTETDRPVFIKLRNPAEDEYATDRVRREAEVLGYLSHAQIPTLYDADPEAEAPYVVTQLMPGESIPETQDGKRYPARLATAIGTTVLELLEYTHEQGIIHRDIKPKNILSAGHSRLSLVDFDVAQYRDQSTAQLIHDDKETYYPLRVEPEVNGISIGTPSFMSPEQSYGRHVGPSSDIYSTGAMLCRMLTGELLRGESATMVVRRTTVGSEAVIPRNGIPDALQAVISRATQRDPADRYKSAGEMREALEASVYSGEDGHRGGLALKIDRFIHRVRA
jgi:serine/threonine protein kinase